MRDEDILKMIKENAQVKAFIETAKEFLRWALSYFITWLLANGYSFFAKSNLSSDTLLIIGACFRAADFFWHRYQKQTQTDIEGKSLGLYRF